MHDVSAHATSNNDRRKVRRFVSRKTGTRQRNVCQSRESVRAHKTRTRKRQTRGKRNCVGKDGRIDSTAVRVWGCCADNGRDRISHDCESSANSFVVPEGTRARGWAVTFLASRAVTRRDRGQLLANSDRPAVNPLATASASVYHGDTGIFVGD